MQELRVLLVEDNPGDARLVKEMLVESKTSTFQVETVNCLIAAIEALAHDKFDVALVDLSLPDSHGLATLSTIQRHARGTPVVALTGNTSESMALTAVQHGAQDYLAKGELNADSLVRALQYAVARHPKASEKAEAQPAASLGVLGAKGGVGATTIACHYAIELRRQTDKKVLLADLDASAASASFLMKAQSDYTAADASANLHRLDASYWKNLVCSTSHGVDLLRSPGAKEFGDYLNGERIRHVIRFARTLYDYIVVDLGRLNGFSLSLIEQMSKLLVVTTPELPSLYEASRLLKKFGALEMRERTQLLLNRSSRQAGCTESDIERVMGCPVAATLGDYASEVHEAYSDGRFLDERQQLNKHIKQLVAKSLGGDKPETPGRTRLGLFRFARVT